MSKNLRLYLEIAEETKRLTMEGLEFNAALRQAKEMYKKKLITPPTKVRATSLIQKLLRLLYQKKIIISRI